MTFYLNTVTRFCLFRWASTSSDHLVNGSLGQDYGQRPVHQLVRDGRATDPRIIYCLDFPTLSRWSVLLKAEVSFASALSRIGVLTGSGPTIIASYVNKRPADRLGVDDAARLSLQRSVLARSVTSSRSGVTRPAKVLVASRPPPPGAPNICTPCPGTELSAPSSCARAKLGSSPTASIAGEGGCDEVRNQVGK